MTIVRKVWLLGLMVLAAGAAQAARKPIDTGIAPEKRLHALFHDEWERALREDPTGASALGDSRYNDRWPDTSWAAQEKTHRDDVQALARLHAIPRAELVPAEQLNYQLFERQLQESIEGYAFHNFLIPLNQRGGIQTANELTEILPFANVKDYQDWLARLQGFGRYMDGTIALMRQGIAEKRLNPQVVMNRIPAQIDKQIVSDPAQSLFFAPFKTFAADVPAADRQRLAAAAQEAVATVVVPAFRRFKTFFENEYLPACPQAIGASFNRPDGAANYAFQVKRMTTTALTPDEIHAIGLKEVARIEAEMHKAKERAGFQGDMPAFFAFLRSDPQFFFHSPDELLNAYRTLGKRIDPELPKLFATLPRLTYGVRAIPDAIAPDTTTAYYQPGAADGSRAGYFYANTYQLDARPKWEMEALTLHEAVPGHHLQIALAQELGELPMFRRQGLYTAYVEGWGLYAESLGSALGLYQDPYSRMGQLSFEMWRAVRLVVDTGMHHQGWTRERAIAYFREKAPRAEQDIVNEIDRYIAWPGQALAYKIGQLKISELRARAEHQLGSKFDLRRFHDVVLGAGSLPLEILENKVDAWIAKQL